MRNGSECSEPPRNVMPPMISERASALPRPVCSPVSDRPSDRPMLMPAPSGREADEQRRVRAAQVRGREDRRQGRDRAVDQADEARLDDLEDKLLLVGLLPAAQPGEQAR